ncbi:plasmid pRiA4b ORF-3 family protein [Solibacillus sp. FSL W7-1436]|uniref:plasmid pRiA4b ORF-3 family protein n=1 Tax=Solibacillus sp. FSL W7-1436 TaxID=2921705 RepID=UPI0030FBAC1A
MIIQCTKKVLDTLNVDTSQLVSPDGFDQYPESFFGWHANIVTIYRRKVLVLMNNETRFPVVINRLLKKDLANLHSLIYEGIRVALRMEGVSESVIEKYFALSKDLSFSKTVNRSMVAKLNRTVNEVEVWAEYLDKDVTIQRFISPLVSKMIQSDAQNKGYYPKEKMLESLAKITDAKDVTQIMDVELYQLNIQLDLDGHEIWRRVLIPANYSFRSLHNLIQIVFDWQNYHLHEFSVARKDNRNLKIVMDDDPDTLEFADSSADEIVQERFVSLAEIFSQHPEVIYEYDFGDSWEHIITLEKSITATSQHAKLIEGKGERPPEDVGGLHGFNEYLAMINDPNSAEDKDFMEWAASQKERNFSLAYTNHRLKSILNNYYYNENAQILDTHDYLSRFK